MKIVYGISLISLFFAMLCCAWRLWRGPRGVDRIVALDTLYVLSVLICILAGMIWQDSVFVMVAVLIAFAGSISTVVLAKRLCTQAVFTVPIDSEQDLEQDLEQK
jgi:multicomponent K+:H+ antiporter subunit F